jgi:prevent-host-death family protein
VGSAVALSAAPNRSHSVALIDPDTLVTIPATFVEGWYAHARNAAPGCPRRDFGACVYRSTVDSTRSISDNPIMAEISATDASKRFADMLDAVEHRGETFTVVRRGRPIATIAPASHTTLAELREFLRAHPPDDAWQEDLADVRRFVGSAPTEDPWSD